LLCVAGLPSAYVSGCLTALPAELILVFSLQVECCFLLHPLLVFESLHICLLLFVSSTDRSFVRSLQAHLRDEASNWQVPATVSLRIGAACLVMLQYAKPGLIGCC
jgi:hypothetical protein